MDYRPAVLSVLILLIVLGGWAMATHQPEAEAPEQGLDLAGLLAQGRHQRLLRKLSADNALIQQSERNPDGWGVAYYIGGAPHVVKSVSTAVSDEMFRRVSGVVTSETVLAHVRKATQGQLTVFDTHPFQYGSWVMVHNGNIAKCVTNDWDCTRCLEICNGTTHP